MNIIDVIICSSSNSSSITYNDAVDIRNSGCILLCIYAIDQHGFLPQRAIYM